MRAAIGAVALGGALLGGAQGSAEATTYFWIGGSSGTVGQTTRWSTTSGGSSAGTYPGITDSAVFDANGLGACSINVNATFASVSINTGYTGTVSLTSGSTLTTTGNFSQAAGTFTGSTGTITIGGDLALSGGTLNAPSGLLEVKGAFNKTGGTFTHDSGRVMLSAGSAKTFASNGATFNDLYINDGLVGYWKLDENTGTAIADASGHGNNGTLVNGPTWVTGASLPSVNFDDTSGINLDGSNDYASLGINSLPAINGSMTVAFWMYYASIPSTQQNAVVLYCSGSSSLQLGFLSSKITAFGAGPVTMVAATSTPTSGWHHVAYTFDGTNHRLYVDGGTAATSTVAPNTGATTAALLGNYTTSGGSPFGGRLDDVRIYNRVLSSTEISGLATGNQSGTGVATQTLSGSPTIASDLVIASGTLAAGTSTVTVGGNWLNYGGIYTVGATGSVVFNGSAATNKILSAGSPFDDVSVTGTGTWTLADRMEIDPAHGLTTTAGAFSLSSRTLRAGNITRNGAVTITPSTGTVVLAGSASKTTDAGSFTNLRVEPVAATNLIAYWKLDAGEGPTAADFSGNGNTGTLASGAEWTDSGLPSGILFDDPAAVTFDGSASQYIATPSLPAVLQPTTVTMSAWYKATTVDSNGGEVISGSDRYTLRVYSNTEIKVVKRTGTSTWVELPGTVANALDGNWHHLAGVVSASGMFAYFDGVLVASNVDTTAIDYVDAPITVLAVGHNPSDGAYDFTGTIDDVRVYNTALGAAQIAILTAGLYPPALAGTPTYTLGFNTTVSGTLSVDNGTLATSSFTLNASSASAAATVYSGTYAVGSTTNTFAGGLTVKGTGTLVLSSSGGTVKIGSTKTLNIDGTLSASSTGAIIQTAGAAATYYNFNVGTSATATPTVNISGLQVKNTTSNGMYINSVVGSSTTFNRFDNIAFSGGTGSRLLQIYASSLYLVSNGCSFDAGATSGTTTKNVTLRGDGSATETRAMFGNATCLNGSSPTYSLCEANDDDDDSTGDGIGDTPATNGAVIQWVHAAMDDTSGTIVGFPTAAFDWNTFTYYSTYAAYHDVNGGTADRIYVRDTNGNFTYPNYYWDSPTGVDLVGAPRYDTISSVHYVYVATTSGTIYRLKDDTTNHTLTADSTGGWVGANNPFNCSCTITTPLALDTNNLYWGGTASAANKVWTLVKSTRTLVSSSPVSVTAVVSGAAPALWSSYVIMGSLAHLYKLDTTAQTLTTDYAPTSAGTMNGRVSVINSKAYAADDKGYLWVVDPTLASASSSAVLWSYHDNTNHSGCAAGSTCAITGAVYVDSILSRAYHGDSDGHLYASYNSSGTTGAQLTGFPFRPGTSSDVYGTAPLYKSGVLVAGTTTGNVYLIDVNGGSGPVLKRTYKLGATTNISGISYDNNSSSYMFSTSDPSAKDGALFYVDLMSDPTPGSN
jgi:Concanavalin A-like lectin/glucanases superfamily